MKRLSAWVVRNLDAFFALIIALSVALLGVANIASQDVVNSAILLILAVMAEAILRDRWKRSVSDGETRKAIADSTSILRELPPRLDRMMAVEEVLGTARTAFDDISMIRVLNGNEVGQAHAEAREHTDRWYFKGGTGTFLRAVTLPNCIERARSRNSTLDFRIEILDPTDEAVCARYAHFRQSLSSRPATGGERWTVDRTRKESFATILAACWQQQQSGLLRIEVYLSSVMTTFRFDLSSMCVIITQENPRTPALMVEHERVYYHRWNIELQYSREQARQVAMEQAKQVPLDDEPTVEQTRRLFTALALPLPRSFSDRDISEIVHKAIQPKNPYES
jgi:hypothetical protein